MTVPAWQNGANRESSITSEGVDICRSDCHRKSSASSSGTRNFRSPVNLEKRPACRKRIGSQCGTTLHFTRDALQALEHYHFPGNVRELSNIVQRAAAHAHDGVICVEHLHLPAESASDAADGSLQIAAADKKPISEIEREYTKSLLEQHNGNRKRVASILGISERTLYRRLKNYQPALFTCLMAINAHLATPPFLFA